MALKSERVLTSFKDKYGYSWDYAIVLDSEPPKEDAAKHNSNNKPPPYTVPELRALLARAGPLLATRWFHSNDRKQTMVTVRATVKAFRQHARVLANLRFVVMDEAHAYRGARNFPC